MRPYELRPPVLGFGFVSAFSGLVFVTSTKSDDVWKRRPGLVGLRLRMGITYSHPCQLPKMSMLSSPAARVTMPRFCRAGALYTPVLRLRERFALRLMV